MNTLLPNTSLLPFTIVFPWAHTPTTQFQEALRDYSSQMNVILYLSKCQKLLTFLVQLQSPFSRANSWGVRAAWGDFGVWGVLLRFWVVFAMHEQWWRGGECCCLSQYILVDISLMPKSSIWECSCFMLCAAFGLTQMLLSQKASCPKWMKQRVGGEHGVVGRAPPPCLEGLCLCWSSTKPSWLPAQHFTHSFSYQIFAFLNAFDGLPLLEHHRSAERLSEVLED